MRTRLKLIHLASPILVLALVTLSCATLQARSGGALKTETQSVELGAETAVRMKLSLNQGKLTVGGGSPKLVEGSFSYNVPDWHPKIDYTVDGSQGLLMIDQPDEIGSAIFKDAQNEWDLLLNETVPFDIDISTGVGESNLDLSSLLLSKVNIQTGAGETTVDLSGAWDHDLFVRIQGGIGKVSVKLPRTMGVTVETQSGIGNVRASGLNQDGNVYTNEAFGQSAQTLHLTVEAGIGEIELSVE